MDMEPGTTVPGETPDRAYTIERRLAHGKYGVVYEVRDPAGAAYALKTIRSDSLDPQILPGLLNEGQLAGAIRHENVLHVLYFHDGRQHPGIPAYMIMEYADGGSLAELLQRRRAHRMLFPALEIRAMFLQLAEGMKAINATLVHGDIKPGNILLAGGTLKITDFALAKVFGQGAPGRPTKRIFAAPYASPESWRMEPATQAMDMYSMGIVFYEVATLDTPYVIRQGRPLAEAWRSAHSQQRPRAPSTFNPGLDAPTAQVILRMLAKHPDNRYPSWDAVLAALSSR